MPCARSSRCSTSWQSCDGGSRHPYPDAEFPYLGQVRAARHVPVAAGPQLPALRLGSTGLAHRHLDAAGGAGLARPRTHELRYRARHRHRVAVRPVAAARPVGRRAGRPRRQAEAAARHPDGARARGPGARPPRHRRCRSVLARAGARHRARRDRRGRHAGAAVVRRRDGRQGRPDQCRRHQLHDLQHRPHPRPGRRRCHDQRGRHRLGVRRERGIERRRAHRSVDDATGGALPGAAVARAKGQLREGCDTCADAATCC